MNVLIIGVTSTRPCQGHRPASHTFGGSSMPKAVVLTGYGPPDVLVWKDVALPEPGPGQVRIRVKAAGVSPSDAKIRHGDVQTVFRLPPKAVLGFEAAGVDAAIGPAVSGVKARTIDP